MVLVALTSAGPVGVDVESNHRHRPIGIARHFLSETEPITDEADLLTYWCRKESIVKATGDGLRVSLRRVIVSAPDMPPRLIRYCGFSLQAAMSDLELGHDFSGAVTVLTDAELEVTVESAEPLLKDWLASIDAPSRPPLCLSAGRA